MQAVRKRCVFYVSGFDPKGAGHYHALYQQESAKQGEVNGWRFEVGPRQRPHAGGNPFWEIDARQGDVHVRTHYEFMRWDDVVRKHWPRSTGEVWLAILRATWFNVRQGSLWKMFLLSWPSVIALFTPFLLVLFSAVAVPVAAAAAGWWAYSASGHPLAGAAASIAAAVVAAWVGLRLESRYSMYWLMRSYDFTRKQALGQTPDLDGCLDVQAARLAQRLQEGIDDEVLVVGHSSGAIMAVEIVARARRLLRSSAAAPSAISLLTLGQVIPLLGAIPHAAAFRRALGELAEMPALDWIDFSAPPDGCCFPLSDPVEGCGVEACNRLADHPKLLSPRFAAMFDAGEYSRLRSDKFKLHFQYIMSSHKAVDYDYFLVTAGQLTLRDRFAAFPSVTQYIELRPFRRRPGSRGD
jgi:hypothetical protein